jgi:hypothetical protein
MLSLPKPLLRLDDFAEQKELAAGYHSTARLWRAVNFRQRLAAR